MIELLYYIFCIYILRQRYSNKDGLVSLSLSVLCRDIGVNILTCLDKMMELMPFSRVNMYQAYAHIVGNIFKSK